MCAAEVEKKLTAFKDTYWNLETQIDKVHLNVYFECFLSTSHKICYSTTSQSSAWKYNVLPVVVSVGKTAAHNLSKLTLDHTVYVKCSKCHISFFLQHRCISHYSDSIRWQTRKKTHLSNLTILWGIEPMDDWSAHSDSLSFKELIDF